MYIIAISNEKGGVAKTTTTLSLGAALAETGKKVLLVDLDAQANLALAMGLEVSSGQKSIAAVLMENLPLTQVIQKSVAPNLDIAPSSHDMGMAERFLPLQPGHEVLLKNALTSIAGDYDVVLMDCPPFLGAVTSNALIAANLLLIPTQAEYFSIYALRNLMGWIRRIRDQYNPGLMYRMLLTMYDRRNRTHRMLSEQLRQNFSTGVLETIISTDTKLRESPLAGVPILTHAPRSRAAEQYRALAQEILVYVQETNLQPA